MFLSELRQFSANFDNFGRNMAKRLKLCEVHSFSTAANLRHHTDVLNADVRNCYTTLKVVICSKLSNDLISTQKMCFSRLTSSYNSAVQNCQNLCSKWAPRIHEHERLDDDATENVKPHLQLHIFCGVVAFAASREYVTVQE